MVKSWASRGGRCVVPVRRVRRRMVSRNGTVLGLKRMGQSYLYANVAATLRAPVLVAMVACKCHIRSKPACSRLDIPIVA